VVTFDPRLERQGADYAKIWGHRFGGRVKKKYEGPEVDARHTWYFYFHKGAVLD
jgi:hypothetical protein